VRVLEVSSDSIAVSYGAGVLAGLGHDVWKIEIGPGGDDLRRRYPSVAREGHISVAFAHSASVKRHDWIEDATVADIVALLGGENPLSFPLIVEALAWADVIVTAFSDVAIARGEHRVVLVTPFGLGSERNDWMITGPTLFHLSGLGIVSPRSAYHGENNDGPPEAPWGFPLEYLCGNYVAFAALGLGRLDAGSLADLSLLDCLLPLTRRETAAWQYDGFRASRRERLWKVGPSGFYKCADGYLYLHVVEDRQWLQLCRSIDAEVLEKDVRLADSSGRFSHESEIDEVLVPWCKARNRDEIFAILGASGIPCGPAFSVREARAFGALIDPRTLSPSQSWISPLPIRVSDSELRWLGESDLVDLALPGGAGQVEGTR
jgi:CoA-transferase family III